MIVVLAVIPVNQEIRQAAVAHDPYHFWWSEYGPLLQASLMAIAGYGIAGVFGLMMFFVIVFPVTSLRDPAILWAQSALENIQFDATRRIVTAVFWFGLGAIMLWLMLLLVF